MIRLIWKPLLKSAAEFFVMTLALVGVFLALALSGCASAASARAPFAPKIYVHYFEPKWCAGAWCQGKSGFFRSQDLEVLSYDSATAQGLYCTTSADFVPAVGGL